MESCSLRFSPIGRLHPEFGSEGRSGLSRLTQIGNQSVSRADVVCPEPGYPVGVPSIGYGLGICRPKPSILPVPRRDYSLEILDMILNKDEYEESDLDTSNQVGFFCSSPPVRTTNPIVHDPVFVKQRRAIVLSSRSNAGMKSPMKLENGPPTCGSSMAAKPKVRIEGFSCKNQESHGIVSALA